MPRDRRVDNKTAESVCSALILQKELGFAAAFAMLKDEGIDPDFAARILHPHFDRRRLPDRRSSPRMSP